MKRKLKIILPIVLIVLLVILGTRYIFHVEEDNHKDYLQLFGHVEIRTTQLAFIEQERIERVLVEEGVAVTAGQPLAILQKDRLKAQMVETRAQVDALQDVVNRLEAGTRSQQVDQAKAEVQAAKTRVANAEQTYKRLLKTSGTGVTSEQDVDNARTQLAVGKAQLEVKEKALDLALEGPRKEEVAEARNRLRAAKAGLKLLDIRLGDMTLKAPMNGTIQNRILEPGEMAGPSRPVFTLALNDPKWVRAYVPEPSLGLIAQGMRAKIQSDSFTNATFEGWIGFISPVAEFTPKSVETTDLRTKLVYEVRVFVRDPGNHLRLGMPVTVTVDLTSKPDNTDNAPTTRGNNNPPAVEE